MAARPDDERYMAAALRLSRWHRGATDTNPSVGCLIVKDGVILGAAVTAPGGRPHAETQALKLAGPAAEGATAYATLEPCSHHGKTPPCADALIAAKVARVVVSVIDPDERIQGRGVAMLEAAGIEVCTGVLETEGRSELAGYLSRKIKKRPQVTLKLAVSADGAIGRPGAGHIAVSGPLSHSQSHLLRAESDAILIGIGTALADDPELTCRIDGLENRSPRAYVLDRHLDLPAQSRLVAACKWPLNRPLTIVCNRDANSSKRQLLEAADVAILATGTDDLSGLCRQMAADGVSTLIVEGGAAVARSFLAQGLVDRILLFSTPLTLGTGAVAAPFDRKTIPDGFRLVRSEQFGPDLAEEYERRQ